MSNSAPREGTLAFLLGFVAGWLAAKGANALMLAIPAALTLLICYGFWRMYGG